MGRDSKWIKNLGRNFSIDSINKYFSNTKVKPMTREEYEKHRYSKTKKNLKYDRDNITHNNAVEKIYNNPSLIGINDTFYNAETEVDFFDKEIHKGAVDVFIETKNDIYAIEYKNKNKNHSRKHAKIQLKKAKYYIKKNFGTDITKLLYVSENFEVEILDRIVPYK